MLCRVFRGAAFLDGIAASGFAAFPVELSEIALATAAHICMRGESSGAFL
jgi:hypothetical protein